jgi:hypothetical protein
LIILKIFKPIFFNSRKTNDFFFSQFADKPLTVSFNEENLQIMIVIMNILKTYRLTLESNHPFLVLKRVSGNSGINHQRRLISGFLIKV